MPSDKVLETYRLCVEGLQDDELRSRLSANEGEVLAATLRFENAVQQIELHKLDREEFGPPSESGKKEHENLYTYRLAKKGSIPRRIYERIKLASPVCPLCGHRLVETLDHHLPKAKYSYLSVSPSNLIPACSDCNHIKTSIRPAVAEHESLHPYFDDFDDEIWLSAEVDAEQYPVIDFYVDPPQRWSKLAVARVSYHFEVFGLNFLYMREAVAELAGDRHFVNSVLDGAGDGGVRRYLEAKAKSWVQYKRNRWRTALYRALADSDWYCAGGFKALQAG